MDAIDSDDLTMEEKLKMKSMLEMMMMTKFGGQTGNVDLENMKFKDIQAAMEKKLMIMKTVHQEVKSMDLDMEGMHGMQLFLLKKFMDMSKEELMSVSLDEIQMHAREKVSIIKKAHELCDELALDMDQKHLAKAIMTLKMMTMKDHEMMPTTMSECEPLLRKKFTIVKRFVEKLRAMNLDEKEAEMMKVVFIMGMVKMDKEHFENLDYADIDSTMDSHMAIMKQCIDEIRSEYVNMDMDNMTVRQHMVVLKALCDKVEEKMAMKQPVALATRGQPLTDAQVERISQAVWPAVKAAIKAVAVDNTPTTYMRYSAPNPYSYTYRTY